MPEQVKNKPVTEEIFRLAKIEYLRKSLITPGSHYLLDKDYHDHQEFIKF